MSNEGEGGRAYWRRLDAEEQDRKRRQEECERPLLEGHWISASKALLLASSDSDASSAKQFLVASAAQTMNNRPMLRTRAATAQARTEFALDPVRRDRIVHLYEWDGEVVTAFWKTGLFRLRTRHVIGRELTLTGVEFSLDDLEKLIGSAEGVGVTADGQTDPETPTDLSASGKPRPGRPSTGGFSISDVPAFKEMRILITAGAPLTTAAKRVEAERYKGSATSHWERYRKAYPNWLKSLGDNEQT